MGFLVIALLVVMGVLLYFLPSLVASRRAHPSSGGIMVMNFFLGWTFIFWVFALIWACSDNSRNNTVVFVQNPGATNFPVHPQNAYGAGSNTTLLSKPSSGGRRSLGLALLVVAGIVIAIAIIHPNKSTIPNTTQTDLEPAKSSGASESRVVDENKVTDTARAISAPMLWRIYHENEVSADSEFKGSLIEVYGVVTEVSEDAFGSEIVGLNTSDKFESAHAYFDKKDESELSALRRGEVISVVCVGGGLVIGSPVLRNCHIHQGAIISPPRAEWNDLTSAQWKKLGFELIPSEPDSIPGVEKAPSNVEVPSPTNQ